MVQQNINLVNLNTTQGFKIIGANGLSSNARDASGWSVSDASDVNGDGYADIVIGAPGISGSNSAGISYVIFGKQTGITDIDLDTLTSSQGFSIIGANNGDYSGLTVSGAGDINNDGYDDVLIGAPNAILATGISYIIFGKANGFSNIDLSNLTISQGFSITGSNHNTATGYSVSGAGDINGDGFADIIIGAPNGIGSAGISYIIFGKANGFSNIDLSNLTISQGFSITGATANDQSGFSVSDAGDINGDGFADIIIGAPYANSEAGISYAIFGKQSGFFDITLSSLTITQGFSIAGATAGDRSGYSVSGAGDVNGDGYKDIIIGAYKANSEAGISYIIFGKSNGFSNIILSNLAINQGFSITGISSNSYSGWSVASAGDINGDGYDDIIIGSPGAINGNGVSYVILGKETGFSNIDLANLNSAQSFSITGANGDYSGYSVSGVGDINNDGYTDLVIGAIYAAPYGRIKAGISYVIFGAVSGFTTASPTPVSTIAPTEISTHAPILPSHCPVVGEICTNLNNIFDSLTQKVVDLCISTYNSTNEKTIPINMNFYNPKFKKTIVIDKEEYDPKFKKTIGIHMSAFNPQKEKVIAIDLSTYDSTKYKLYNPEVEKVVKIDMMTFDSTKYMIYDPSKYMIVDKHCQSPLSESSDEHTQRENRLSTKSFSYLRGLDNSILNEHIDSSTNDLLGSTVSEHFDMN